MKITYHQTPLTRAGQRIPIQDVEDGEKFRVVSQLGQYLANVLADDTHDRPRCRFKRRGNSLYILLKRGDTRKWSKLFENYFVEEYCQYEHPWMTNLRNGSATVIVEIY